MPHVKETRAAPESWTPRLNGCRMPKRRKAAPWRENKRLVAEGFSDLKYVPRERCGWDVTLASHTRGLRTDIERRQPDLDSWAAGHCRA